MSKLFVDEIVHQSSQGSGTITLGASGETITTASGVTGLNYPAFEARLNGNQSVSHNTYTKVQCGDEILDTDNCYDATTNYRFTPTVAGKYFCYFNVRGFAGGSDPDGVRILSLQPYKNGSGIRIYSGFDSDPNEMRHMFTYASAVIEFNGSSDYLEFFAMVYAENLSSTGVVFNGDQSYFGAYRIGT